VGARRGDMSQIQLLTVEGRIASATGETYAAIKDRLPEGAEFPYFMPEFGITVLSVNEWILPLIDSDDQLTEIARSRSDPAVLDNEDIPLWETLAGGMGKALATWIEYDPIMFQRIALTVQRECDLVLGEGNYIKADKE
jgi:hypothetical protein